LGIDEAGQAQGVLGSGVHQGKDTLLLMLYGNPLAGEPFQIVSDLGWVPSL
jgi:hypothetical protein